MSKHGKLKRSIASLTRNSKLQQDYHDVNWLMRKVQDEERLRQTVSWLPPAFSWFIQCTWTQTGKLDKLNLPHRLGVLKKNCEKRRFPALWTLSYPEKGSPVELRLHSDLTGKFYHAPLQIAVTDNFLTNHPDLLQAIPSFCELDSPAN